MSGVRYTRRLAALLMLAVGTLSFSAPAQVSSQPSGCQCPVSGLCCQCADGRRLQVDISTGTAPWRVRRGNAPSQLAITLAHPAWTASLPPAQWIRPPGSPTDSGDYVYELQYTVPNCVIPARFAITGQLASDETASVSVDGGPAFATQAGFQQPNVASFTVPPAGLTPGTHTLTVVVRNTGDVTGLLLRASIITLCPLQRGPGTPATGELGEAPNVPAGTAVEPAQPR